MSIFIRIAHIIIIIYIEINSLLNENSAYVIYAIMLLLDEN
jgi:hypothetical protein